MADNYLEKRMEDLRAGRLKTFSPGGALSTRRVLGGAKRGVAEFPFPPRRVLVTRGLSLSRIEIVRCFLKTGSKVAVFDSDREAGAQCACKEGVRFSHVDMSDTESVGRAFSDLLKAWRDVDILISSEGSDIDFIFAKLWAAHRNRFPVPFGYPGRFITLGVVDADTVLHIKEALSPYRISMHSPRTTDSDLPLVCLYLSLPVADLLQ